MEGGERKEEASLPPDYVSLAQLQQRWLQKKQEEVKRKEEEEKRELRRKQEEDERREREARAENERERNRIQGAKIGGLIEERGKGKEVVRGGDGNGGGNSKKKWGKKRGSGGGGGSSGVEVVANVCVVEILPRNEEIGDVKGNDIKKNGRNRGSAGVNELKQSEVAMELEKVEEDEKDCGNKWRGSVSGSGRGEIGGERGRGRGNYRNGGRGRGGERGRNGGNPERMLREYGPVVVEGNGVDSKFEDKAEDEISEVCSEGNRLRVADRNDMRGRYSKAKEDGAKGQGSNGGSGRGYRAIGTRGRDKEAKEEGVEGEGSNGEKLEVELEKKVDHKALPRRGQNKGFGKVYRNGIRVKDNEVKDEWVEGEGSNGEKVEVELEKKVDHKVLARKGQNRGFGKRYRGNGIRGQDNEAKEEGLEGHGSTSELVEVELEKKVDHKVLPRNGENRVFGKSYRGNGIQGRDNEAKVEGVEGEGSTGELVEVELEKKVDHKILPRRGEYRGFPEAYRGNGIRGRNIEAKEEGVEGERSNGEVVEVELDKKVDQKILPIKGENKGFRRNRVNGIQGRDNKATEEGVVGEGSSGDTVEVEVEKKVEHKVVPRKGEYRGSGRTYRANGIHGRDNKATEDGFEGEISNADKESVVIVKPVYSKVLPRNGQNMSFGRGYLGNGNRRGGKRVWVKKEEFDA